jgi:hypothetical protein
VKALTSYSATELQKALQKVQLREAKARELASRAEFESYPASVKVASYKLERISGDDQDSRPGYLALVRGPGYLYVRFRLAFYQRAWEWAVEVSTGSNVHPQWRMHGRHFQPPLVGQRGLERCVKDLEQKLHELHVWTIRTVSG